MELARELIIIPDIHGRTFWKDAIPYIQDGTPVIFLGDYLDPYPHENISSTEALENFKEILEIVKGRDNVALLVSNHDCTYIWPEAHICECRTDYNRLREIQRLFLGNLDQFNLYFFYKNIIFTHAGVHPEWLKELVQKSTVPETLQYLENAIRDGDPDAISRLGYVSRTRGGWEKAGSCVWADIREFTGEDMQPVGYQQIVGHTQQLVKQRTPGGFIWVGGEPVRVGVPGLDIACLDCHQCFYLDSEGDIRFLKDDKIIN